MGAIELTDNQKLEFYEEGWLKIPGAVPQVMINAARQAINHALGQGMRNPFAEIRGAPVITDMFNKTPIFSLVESALGEGNLEEQRNGAVKLNFPSPVGAAHRELNVATAGPPLRTGGHVDGIAQARDFLLGRIEKTGYNRDFTAFATVYLDDVPSPFCGNFTLWPKSHRTMEAYLQEYGHEVFNDYMPDVDLPEGPVQTTGEPGDVILAHHAIVHTASANACPNIRYAIIFRPKHVNIKELGLDGYTNIWQEWDGVREAREQAVAAD